MTAQEIYEKYRLMPSLQLHQLRVAAVGKCIAESLGGSVNIHDIVSACLLHDMGNIIKFDLNVFPEFSDPEGVPYWQSVKDDYIAAYGTHEHEATIAISKEIGVSDAIVAYIDGVGFSKLEKTKNTDSFEQKIVEYADLRVGPHGILSMRDRLEEARKRYAHRHSDMPSNIERYAVLERAANDIEKQIFDHSSLSPSDITDERVAPLIDELKYFQVV